MTVELTELIAIGPRHSQASRPTTGYDRHLRAAGMPVSTPPCHSLIREYLARRSESSRRRLATHYRTATADDRTASHVFDAASTQQSQPVSEY